MLQRNNIRRFILLLLLLPFGLSAQNDQSDTLSWKASLDVTGFWQSGNVDTWIFRAKSDVRFKPSSKLVFRTKNSYLYQEFGKEKADEDILSLNFLNIGPERNFSPLLLAFVSSNFRREIELRSLLGMGVTYQVFKKEDNWLKFAVSSEYENTNFNASDFNRNEYDGSTSIQTFRGTLWANGRYHLFNNKMVFNHESFYQPSLERGNNYRWQIDLGLELPIKKSLSFKVNYIQTYESIVIQGQHEADRFLTFGLSLKNY